MTKVKKHGFSLDIKAAALLLYNRIYSYL